MINPTTNEFIGELAIAWYVADAERFNAKNQRVIARKANAARGRLTRAIKVVMQEGK